VPHIYIDAPQYAALLDPQMREGYRQRGSDPDKLIDLCIEVRNPTDKSLILTHI
jgi:5-methyltetrahydropteroyltriglutamate--homocysteine methyltransferase